MGKYLNWVVALRLEGHSIPGYLNRDGDMIDENALSVIERLIDFGAFSKDTAVPLHMFRAYFGGEIFIHYPSLFIVDSRPLTENRFHVLDHIYLNMNNPVTQTEVAERIGYEAIQSYIDPGCDVFGRKIRS